MHFRNKFNLFSGRRFFYLNLFVLALYIKFAIPFYSLAYEVPDYFKYYGFAKEHFPARDGFSSLFILISSHLINSYGLIHWSMLFLIAISLWLLNFTFSIVCKSGIKRFLFIVFTYSLGCWYYWYGKTFYEFPFIVFTYTVMLYLAKDFLIEEAHLTQIRNPKRIKSLRLLFLLGGFCLSWKAHALFPVMGLISLIWISNKALINSIKRSQLLILAGVFCCGYLLGNFNLLFDFLGTIQGIRGYKTNANLLLFLLSDDKTAWDHINLYSFQSAIYWLPGAAFILLVTPLFVSSAKRLLCLNLFMTFFFLLVMGQFLSGLTWQGFPYALYFVALMFYVLVNAKITTYKAPIVWLTLVFVIPQYYWLLTHYLPEQIVWQESTNRSIEDIKHDQEEILMQVQKIILQNGSKYRIDLRLKRNSPIYFYNPLQVANSTGWNPIFEKECISPCIPSYQIYIEPYGLYSVKSYQSVEVVNTYKFDSERYRLGWKKFDNSYIDQELYKLRQ